MDPSNILGFVLERFPHFFCDELPVPRDHQVVLFTRKGCHLCELALETLRNEHLEVESIDIDTRPHYLRLYDQVVPIVVIDGKERFRGQVDRRLLRRLLAARRVEDG